MRGRGGEGEEDGRRGRVVVVVKRGKKGREGEGKNRWRENGRIREIRDRRKEEGGREKEGRGKFGG